MYKKLLAFLLAILCIMSCAVVGVSAADTDSSSGNILYFRVPDSWEYTNRVYCHISKLDTGVAFYDWQHKKEKCTQVEGNLYAYDLSEAGIEITDECAVTFSSDTGKQTHPLMLRNDTLGLTAYCDGTLYEHPYNYLKTTAYVAFWENKAPEELGPVMMISSTGNIVGTCKSEYSQTNEKMFASFLKNDLTTAQEKSGKTDQQLIDDIIGPLGISEQTADRIIRDIDGFTLDWGNGYGDIKEPVIDWTYKVVDGNVILTGFKTKGTEVNIPDTIDGMPVTGIEGDSFFYGLYSNQKTINIPASVTKITMPVIDRKYLLVPIDAFNVHEDNPAYTSVDGVLYSKDKKTLVSYPRYKTDKVCTVDEATVTICDYAFYGGMFEEILLPDSVENIGANAFSNCVWLKELNIPSSVKYIDGEAFELNRSLKAVNVASDNKNYCSVDGVLYNKDKTELIYFPMANGITNYSVYDGVTKIGKKAFQSCSSLDEVALPDSVETISYRAFYGCVAEVNIPANLKVIEDEAFAASGITQAILPEGITEIGYRAFGSSGLETLLLPQNLTYIGVKAFDNTNITSVVIPDTVSTVDEGAFRSCSSLDEITIPDSVTYIGENAFDWCPEDMLILGSTGSYAEEYAQANNIKFVDPANVKCGDVNLDGNINIKDATAIQKHIAKIVALSDKGYEVADVDGSGSVNVKDATAIQKHIAGIGTGYPIGEPKIK
ncbi:MAG: leucine-rich repeat protein [Eubacteriales bacterium]|nr:leucine-rich repeat protein [Eubacteriales bacterium]